MDHTNQTRLNDEELTESVLTGAPVYGPADAKVGSVSEVHGAGPDAKLIVDIGGFLGIGAKPIEFAAKDLHFLRDPDGTVHGATNWSKDQLKDLPDYAPRPTLQASSD